MSLIAIKTRPQSYKTFFILNSSEHDRYLAHKFTFISMINTTSERLKARNFSICPYFSFYEMLKFHAQLSMKKVI